MEGIRCPKNYSFLDLLEFKFRLENDITVGIEDFESHSRECEACRERLKHVTPDDIREMKDYYARYKALQAPAPPDMIEETQKRLRLTLEKRR